jgi:predicted RNase H-like HicB family nuclease
LAGGDPLRGERWSAASVQSQGLDCPKAALANAGRLTLYQFCGIIPPERVNVEDMDLKFYSFTIVIEPEESPDEGYYAYSPQLPGCYSNGRTIEETRQNMREAIQQHLGVLLERDEPVPQATGPILEEISIGVPV